MDSYDYDNEISPEAAKLLAELEIPVPDVTAVDLERWRVGSMPVPDADVKRHPDFVHVQTSATFGRAA